MLLSGLIVFGTMAPWIASDLAGYLKAFFDRPHTIPFENEGLRLLLVEVSTSIAILLSLPMATFALAAVISNVAINGLMWTPKKMRPKLDQMNPVNGVIPGVLETPNMKA